MIMSLALNPARRLLVPEATRASDVYERLREAIVTGQIRPNEPLIEADLAAELAVSRTPVRESLQRLFADGLIVARKRGWAVRAYGIDEIRENYELRAGLEGYAARLAAERASDGELTKIVAVHEKRLQLDQPTQEVRVKSNRQFHDLILAAAKNKRLADAVYRAGQFYFNLRVAGLTTEDEMRAANADHGRIAAALLARDGAAAEQATRQHIMHAFEIMYRVGEL